MRPTTGMSPLGSLLALAGAEAVLAVLFGGLYYRLSRLYERSHLRRWTRAWGFLLAHIAVALVDGLLVAGGLASSPWRGLTVAAYVATSTLGLLSLALGIREFVTDTEVRPAVAREAARAAIVLAAAAGVMVGAGWVPQPWAGALPEGVRALLASGLAAWAAVTSWRHGSWDNPGTVLTRIGLTALSLAQANYVRFALTAGLRGEPLWSPYLTLVDTIIWTLLGVGAVTWLLQQERLRSNEATRAREVLEGSLSQREQRFEAILNGLTERIFIVDSAGRIAFAGRPASPENGFASGDLEGEPFEAFVHPDDLDALRRVFTDVVSTPGAVASAVCRTRTKVGGWVIYECQGRNLLHEPAVRGILVTARDVTERVRLEGQLRDAQRMESIGRLAGGVAHDFNNLLTVITGNADLGRDALPPGAPGHGELVQIGSAAARATTLTRQLLSFARRQLVEPRALELGAVVVALEDMVRRLAGGHIEVMIRPDESRTVVRADLGQIEQVILNLVANARDAMPDGGRLTITTGVEHVADTGAPVVDMAPGAYETLSVRDTGSGMSAEVRAHAFEPFFTTKGMGAGTGLGLASCYGIATQHGGYIGVESEPGHGSTFTLYLPAAEPDEAIARPEPSAPRAAGRGRILLVEDDAAVRQVAVRALRARGFEVFEAIDGVDALATLQSTDAIRCVVTDVAMPRLGGVALVRHLRTTDAATPVVFTSGYVDRVSLVDLLDEVTEFLPKPYSAESLAARVRSLIDRSAPARTV